MERCQALTSSGSACKLKAREGHTTCKRHDRKEHVAPTVTRCAQVMTNGQRCTRDCGHGDTLCQYHRMGATQRERKERMITLVEEATLTLWGEHPPTSLEEFVRPIREADWLMEGLRIPVLEHMAMRWAAYLRLRPPPEEKPRSELHGLALDKQNVHTTAIVKQTNTVLEPLQGVPIPEGQDTLIEIVNAWGLKKGVTKVLRDMAKWYFQSFCRKEDDYLYKNTLDSVWARIKLHEHRLELNERLWEECEDAVGQCCEGHISRLASVLVGFDEDAYQKVSPGELLQQRMAAINEMDISSEEKVDHAWRVFTELNIPMQDRYAWVDAF
jgi:predicted DNA-binding antitoxin AbrB/MazE fold protein